MGRFNRSDRSEPRRNFGQRDFKRKNFSDQGGRREMHKAVCSKCGKDCEVPFRPTGNKPVYCNDCFRRDAGGSDSRRFQDRSPKRFGFEVRNEPAPQNNQQFEIINRKLDKILEVFTSTFAKEKEIQKKPEVVKLITKKEVKIPKKKSPVIKK